MFTVPLNNNVSVASFTAAVRATRRIFVQGIFPAAPAQSVVFGRCLAEWKNSANWRLWHCGDGDSSGSSDILKSVSSRRFVSRPFAFVRFPRFLRRKKETDLPRYFFRTRVRGTYVPAAVNLEMWLWEVCRRTVCTFRHTPSDK